MIFSSAKCFPSLWPEKIGKSFKFTQSTFYQWAVKNNLQETKSNVAISMNDIHLSVSLAYLLYCYLFSVSTVRSNIDGDRIYFKVTHIIITVTKGQAFVSTIWTLSKMKITVLLYWFSFLLLGLGNTQSCFILA